MRGAFIISKSSMKDKLEKDFKKVFDSNSIFRESKSNHKFITHINYTEIFSIENKEKFIHFFNKLKLNNDIVYFTALIEFDDENKFYYYWFEFAERSHLIKNFDKLKFDQKEIINDKIFFVIKQTIDKQIFKENKLQNTFYFKLRIKDLGLSDEYGYRFYQINEWKIKHKRIFEVKVLVKHVMHHYDNLIFTQEAENLEEIKKLMIQKIEGRGIKVIDMIEIDNPE